MKKKGFVLVETIVVMCVVLVSLMIIYKTYTTVLKRAEQKKYYDNINDIYKLATISSLYTFDNSSMTADDCDINIDANCTAIINEIMGDITPTFYYFSSISDATTDTSNTLKRYINTLNYDGKFMIMEYTKDNFEHFTSVEVR